MKFIINLDSKTLFKLPILVCFYGILKRISYSTKMTMEQGKSITPLSPDSAGTVKPSRRSLAGALCWGFLVLVLSAGYLLLSGRSSEMAFTRTHSNQPGQTVYASVMSARRRKRGQKKTYTNETQDVVASYSRFSSQHQREDSIDQQQERCRQKAIANQHSVSPDLEFADRAVSGTKLERAGLNRLLESARNREFNVLYIYSLSRLARESVITMPILKKLVHTYNVRCVCVAEGIDTDVTGWEVIASIFSVIHEQFIKDLSASVLRGQEHTLLQGYSVGDWCFGYGSEAVPGTGQYRAGRNSKPRMVYVINDSHAEWVNQIFTWFVDEGYSIGQIVRKLNRKKAPKDHRASTEDWHHALVVRILSNEKYVGVWPWGEMQNVRDPETGKVHQEFRSDEECEKWTREFPHLRIVDDPTFKKAQAKLVANTEKWGQHRSENGRFDGSSSDTNGRHQVRLLHGLLKCAGCGSPFHSDGKRVRCRAGKRGTCEVVTSAKLSVLEKMIMERIGTILEDDQNWFDYALNELLRCYQEYENRVPAAIREKERAIHVLSQKIERLLDSVESGNSPDDLQQRLIRRREEKTTLDNELRVLQREVVTAYQAPNAAWLREQLSKLYEVLQGCSPAANQALRTLVGEEILMEEINHPLKNTKAFRGHFRLHVHGISGDSGGSSDGLNNTNQPEMVSIEFILPDENEAQRQVAKKMYDAGEPEFKIAEALGVSRSRVTAILKEVYALLGMEKPDGRTRRSQIEVKHKTPPLYQAKADEVMKLFNQGLLLGKIADRLGIDRNTVTSSVKYWHEKNGLPVPDGRSRRINL